MFVLHGGDHLERVSLVTQSAQPFADADLFAGRKVSVRGEILQRGAQKFLAVSRDDIRLID
jgi:hypothetical protein